MPQVMAESNGGVGWQPVEFESWVWPVRGGRPREHWAPRQLTEDAHSAPQEHLRAAAMGAGGSPRLTRPCLNNNKVETGTSTQSCHNILPKRSSFQQSYEVCKEIGKQTHALD